MSTPPDEPAFPTPRATDAACLDAARVEARLGRLHRRRLREVWRSAGWPAQDLIEVELIAAGWVERRVDVEQRETVRLTERGVAVLAATLECNRAARGAHEALVARTALVMQRAGRLVWRGLRLRAPLDADAPEGKTRWASVMPDVFSIRNTTVEAYVEPVIHEIKVSRADLLGDLRHADKRASYLALASECWFVLRAGIGDERDVPETCGVVVVGGDGEAGSDGGDGAGATFEIRRPAPRRVIERLPFATWMALAKSPRCEGLDEDGQGLL